MNMSVLRATDEERISPSEYLILEPWFAPKEIIDFISYTPRLSHLYCSNIVESDDEIKQFSSFKFDNI